MRILGIDPGSRITGYGMIVVEQGSFVFIDAGVIKASDQKIAMRLSRIFTGLQSVIKQYSPQHVVVEKIFMHVNPGGALKLGQARGVALLAVALADLSLHEFTARQIKQAVVGYGNADKKQVQYMVQSLLQLNKPPSADAADALAGAMCYARSQGSLLSCYGNKIIRGRVQ